jgi:hypothetical protein
MGYGMVLTIGLRYADSWGLRSSVLNDLVIIPARHQSSQDTEKSSGRQ